MATLRLAILAATLAGGLVAAAPGRADPITEVPAEAGIGQDALRRAMALVDAGDLDKAQAAFEALRTQRPKAVAPVLGLAEIAVRRNDPATAEALLRAAIEANPDSPSLHRAFGRLAAARGQLDETRSAFDTAIRLEPDRTRSYAEAGDLLNQKLGRPDLAIGYYQRAIARDTTNFPAHYGLGLALARTGNPRAALDELGIAARLAPRNPLPDYSRGQVLLRLDQPQQAILAYDAALLRAPRDRPTLLARGALLLNLGRPREARANFATARQVEPKDPSPVLGLAMAAEALGERDVAERLYREALALQPENPLTANNLAWLLAGSRRDLDLALTLARQALAREPNDPNFLGTLGWVLRQRGDLAEAETNLARSAELRPSAEAYTRLAEVRLARGAKAEAEADLRRALALQADYEPARAALLKLR